MILLLWRSAKTWWLVGSVPTVVCVVVSITWAVAVVVAFVAFLWGRRRRIFEPKDRS